MTNQLLQKDSPFVPTIHQREIEELMSNTKQKKTSLCEVFALHTAFAGLKLNLHHEKQINDIKAKFHCYEKDISLFLFGFCTVPQLLLSGMQMQNYSPKKVYQNLNKRSPNKAEEEFGKYLSQLVYDAYSIVEETSAENPTVPFAQITNLCFTKPFNNNDFYLAGLESSKQTFEEISQRYFLEIKSVK